MKPDPHEEAFRTVRRWWRAWVERDLETVKKMLDPQYSEHGDAAPLHVPGLRGIARLMEEATRQSEVSITDWEIYDPVTKLFETQVVCSYAFRISGRRGRRSFALVGRATDVLSHKGEHWTLVSHHGTLDRR